jgi:hypothetical protein
LGTACRSGSNRSGALAYGDVTVGPGSASTAAVPAGSVAATGLGQRSSSLTVQNWLLVSTSVVALL